MRTNFVAKHVAEQIAETHRSGLYLPKHLAGSKIALVSIRGSGDPLPSLDSYWHKVLYLEFDDIDPKHCSDEFLQQYKLMDEGHAEQVLQFFLEVEGEVDEIWAHCQAGVSRSAAVAKFVQDIYGAEGFPRDYALYNKHVTRKLIEAYHRSMQRDETKTPGAHK